MKFVPYWLDTAPQGPDRTATDVGGQADVAVVGAGLTGLSAALHLARKGARVQVLERETVGWGASGRNGGMATTGLSIGFRDAVDRYGFESADRYHGKSWADVERDLERGWDSYKLRGELAWMEIKDAVRDAWDRATGRGR